MRIAAPLAIFCLAVVTTGSAQNLVVTELRLGLDRTRVKAEKLRKGDEVTLKEVLGRRVVALVGEGGEVKVDGADDILVTVPVEQFSAPQSKSLSRQGKVEFRYLEDVHSNLNPDGRYLIDQLMVQGESQLRFRDRRTGRPIPTERLTNQSPLLLDNDDIAPDGAFLQGPSIVKFRLTERASQKMKQFLKKPGRLVAVLLDGELLAISAGVTPVPVKGAKRKKAPKSGSEAEAEEEALALDIPKVFEKPEEASLLVGVLNAGALPYPLTVRSRRLVPVETQK
jgi:preprotein translocase subunit SecD